MSIVESLSLDKVTPRLEPSASLTLDSQARLYRMLSAMVGAGIPVDKALDSLAEQREFQIGLRRTLKALESGHSLAQAFQKGGIADTMVLRLLHLGQSTGNLDEILLSLADLFEWRVRLRAELISRMTYPLILSIACALLVGLGPPLLLRPILDFLRTSGQPLPPATQLVMLLAEGLSSPWTWLALLTGAFATVVAISRMRLQRLASVERQALRIPGLGRFLTSLYSVRFLKALLTCLGSGYPLLSSLTLAADCSQSHVLKEQTHKAASKLIAGEVGLKCWGQLGMLDPMVRNALEIGLGSGKLEPVLQAILKLQDEQLQTALERGLSLLEPIVLGFMGMMVALCILATVSPMMSLLQGIS